MNTDWAQRVVEVACDWVLWSIELGDHQMLPMALGWLLTALEGNAER